MYTQFFGNYLLKKGYIDTVQLVKALKEISRSRIKLGTIALSKGLMTPSEVDECLFLQSKEDKRFGQIAIEAGYLTDDQVNELLSNQVPSFLLLGQTLVEDGCFSNTDLEQYIFEYKTENEIYDLDLSIENKDAINTMIDKFFITTELPHDETTTMYLELMFNNLIRFIGDDFTPLEPMLLDEFPCNYSVVQHLHYNMEYITAIDMTREAALEFSSRYAKEPFDKFDEYVMAALADFLNLHNGIFIVNVSNKTRMELTLDPPESYEGGILPTPGRCLMFPLIYSFGTIRFLVAF